MTQNNTQKEEKKTFPPAVGQNLRDPNRFNDFANVTSSKEANTLATAQVPANRMYMVDTTEPVFTPLPYEQTATVDEGTTTSISLDEPGPVVEYMDSPSENVGDDSACGREADVLAYFDGDGDGEPGTLVTFSSTVQFSAFDTNADGEIQGITFEDTSGNAGTKDIVIYTIITRGEISISRRAASNATVRDNLISRGAREHAYADPYNPDSSRSLRWESSPGLEGTVGPKQYIEINYTTPNEEFLDVGYNPLDMVAPTQFLVSLPFKSRRLAEHESEEGIRSKVRSNISG